MGALKVGDKVVRGDGLYRGVVVYVGNEKGVDDKPMNPFNRVVIERYDAHAVRPEVRMTTRDINGYSPAKQDRYRYAKEKEYAKSYTGAHLVYYAWRTDPKRIEAMVARTDIDVEAYRKNPALVIYGTSPVPVREFQIPEDLT